MKGKTKKGRVVKIRLLSKKTMGPSSQNDWMLGQRYHETIHFIYENTEAKQSKITCLRPAIRTLPSQDWKPSGMRGFKKEQKLWKERSARGMEENFHLELGVVIILPLFSQQETLLSVNQWYSSASMWKCQTVTEVFAIKHSRSLTIMNMEKKWYILIFLLCQGPSETCLFHTDERRWITRNSPVKYSHVLQGVMPLKSVSTQMTLNIYLQLILLPQIQDLYQTIVFSPFNVMTKKLLNK